MKKLGISPRDIEDLFISHAHYDHTGGLPALLVQNNRVKMSIPPSYTDVKNAEEIISVTGSQKLYESIFKTGVLEGIEQLMCVETGKGIIIIAGCSHPWLEHIL